MIRTFCIAVAALLSAIIATPASAQGRGGIPVPALPDQPWEYQTATAKIRVRVLTAGLENPWSLEFLPDASILITERNGRLRLFKDGKLSGPVPGLPEVVSDNFISGLHDVKLHPDFAKNRLVYWVYNKADAPAAAPAAAAPAGGGRGGGAAGAAGGGRGGRGGGTRTLTVARGVFDGTALTKVEDIIRMPGATTISRMLFLPDGTLLVSTYGEPQQMAQDKMGLSGKILRYNADGTIPKDNPFVGKEGYRPEIYTLGHRSPEGLIWHEPTKTIWESEMGPNGGDEINIIKAGGNYGWPLVSLGRSYAGPYQPGGFQAEGMTAPVVNFVPSISATGMTFYTGDRFPAWKGNLFIGGVRYGEVPGTGRIQRIVFNSAMEETSRETLLEDKRWRVRDIRQGPDGLLYVITDERNGALLRIEPAE
ncbi:MAG TPA: PQQ-dependent sugar dehydrogenase [Vicinamibacterales bacterium]|nr:PQQ-dependent sugar dehydrogenase [Vicinamibacterales bacterium]